VERKLKTIIFYAINVGEERKREDIGNKSKRHRKIIKKYFMLVKWRKNEIGRNFKKDGRND
jgi:hypothetical protein